jgi:hypothetical protein
MATITFYGNLTTATSPTGIYIDHSASGLGFFGGDFGLSVPVDSYQDNTYITNSDGTVEAQKLMNTKYASESGTKHNTENEAENATMPNHYAPLNIRFEHDEAVRVKNCQLRIFDRSDITKNASGVTTEVYEIRHPSDSTDANKALNHRGIGAGNHGWTRFLWDGISDNEVSPLSFTESPGASGLNGNNSDSTDPGGNLDITGATVEGAAHESLRHDWYVALSASPDEIGSKTDFGLYFTVEYL